MPAACSWGRSARRPGGDGLRESHLGAGVVGSGAAAPGAGHHHAGARRGPGSARAFGGSAGPEAGMRLPKGAIKPRPSVQAMAPYSPPTAGRAGKLRLDFNENTVGCSPHVIKTLKDRLDAARLSIYPEYGEAKQSIAAYFRVEAGQFTFTNGTDEAIQAFVNTYVDD